MTTRFLALRGALPLLLLLAPLISHCAPEHAEAIRKDKAFTLGLPGASFRPNGKVAVGATFGSAAGKKANVKVDNSSRSGSTTIADDGQGPVSRVVTTTETQISPFVQFFPWDTSAFFVGAGGSYHMAKVKYNEDRTDSTSLAPSTTSVAYARNSTYVGVPLGWAWIWTPGFSLTLDLGPRWKVSSSDKYQDDGTKDLVRTDNRDRTVKAIDGSEGTLALGGGLLIGWSF